MTREAKLSAADLNNRSPAGRSVFHFQRARREKRTRSGSKRRDANHTGRREPPRFQSIALSGLLTRRAVRRLRMSSNMPSCSGPMLDHGDGRLEIEGRVAKVPTGRVLPPPRTSSRRHRSCQEGRAGHPDFATHGALLVIYSTSGSRADHLSRRRSVPDGSSCKPGPEPDDHRFDRRHFRRQVPDHRGHSGRGMASRCVRRRLAVPANSAGLSWTPPSSSCVRPESRACGPTPWSRRTARRSP